MSIASAARWLDNQSREEKKPLVDCYLTAQRFHLSPITPETAGHMVPQYNTHFRERLPDPSQTVPDDPERNALFIVIMHEGLEEHQSGRLS